MNPTPHPNPEDQTPISKPASERQQPLQKEEGSNMKIIKSIAIAAGITAVVAVVLVGPRHAAQYMGTTMKMMRHEVQKNVPIEVEIARLEGLIQTLDQSVLANERKLIEYEVDLEYLQREIQERNEELAAHQLVLQNLRSQLATRNVSYQFAGQTYDWADLNQEALTRLEAFKAQRDYVEVRTATMETMQEAVAMSREQLDQARNQRTKYMELIDQLQAKNIKLKAKEELAATINRLKVEDTSNQFATVHELFERLNKRLEVENKYLDKKIGLARIDSTPGNGGHDMVGRDASAEIAVALELTPVPNRTPIASTVPTAEQEDQVVSSHPGQ